MESRIAVHSIVLAPCRWHQMVRSMSVLGMERVGKALILEIEAMGVTISLGPIKVLGHDGPNNKTPWQERC